MATKRNCITCGKEYEYCRRCSKQRNDNWKTLYCSKECMTIFDACNGFANKEISAEDAKATINDLVKSEDTSKYNKNIKNVLDEIFAATEVVATEKGFEKNNNKKTKIVNDDLAKKTDTTEQK